MSADLCKLVIQQYTQWNINRFSNNSTTCFKRFWCMLSPRIKVPMGWLNNLISILLYLWKQVMIMPTTWHMYYSKYVRQCKHVDNKILVLNTWNHIMKGNVISFCRNNLKRVTWLKIHIPLPCLFCWCSTADQTEACLRFTSSIQWLIAVNKNFSWSVLTLQMADDS